MDPLRPPPLPMDLPPATTLPAAHVAHVANPTPPVITLPSHPSYAEMILEAINTLKERNGSSKRAIAKYIERIYSNSNLPATHSALLTHHLKRLKDCGQIVMVKHSYVLAGSAPQVQANGLKRGPGRPPKAKPVVNPQAQVNSTAGPGPIHVPESVFASLGLVDAVPKKRPGRPRKAVGGGVGLQPTSLSTKKRPGRPPKAKDGSNNLGPGSGVAKPRGRPRKMAGGAPAKPRGRPPKNVAAPTPIDGIAAGVVLVPTAYGTVPALKQRGRPPKTGVGPKKPRRLTGKPLGRPRKNTSAVSVQVSSLQQLLAYQELKSKLEFLQSRIKHTISVLKPCLDSQTAASALAAFQELEELSIIDVTAPISVQSQQTPPQNQVS